MAINLRPFGLKWSIDPKHYMTIPTDFKNKMNMVLRVGNTVSIGKNIYDMGEFLGGGTYGEVYTCKRLSDNLDCCIKIVNNADIYDLVKEVLIQIVIVETTKNKNYPELGFKGPFAPIVYDIGFDEASNLGYIVTQKMRNTFSGFLENRRKVPEELQKAMCIGMIQISTMLSELYNLLKFNHRDFKTDNCMYMYDETGRVQMRLIDFGFSFISYKNMTIRTSSFDFIFDSLPSRDMTQFMYELHTYHTYLPDNIKGALEDLLTFPLDGKVCKMYEGCDKMKKWLNSYEFLNDDSAFNPNGQADVVKKVFIKLYKGLDYKSDLAYAPGLMGLFVAKPAVPLVAPAGMIYNPDTGRWVKADGALGRRLLKEINAAAADERETVAEGLAVKPCPPAKPDRNPKTKRCLKACPEGKKRNATFKCKAKGTAKGTVKTKVVTKACPPTKPDRNPKTKRCVKACANGKKRNATFKCVKA